MSEIDLQRLLSEHAAAPWRVALARWVESRKVEAFITTLIVLNALVLGLEVGPGLRPGMRTFLAVIDRACLAVFVAELTIKLVAYRGLFWRTGWNWFDAFVVGIALVPGAGAWSVLRSLRVLRVLRLLTVIPQLRKVVAAFLHAIPGLASVVMVMSIFYYTAGVLVTGLFGETHPEWFGSLGRSLYTLFQIMTLESWSMGIVRPLMTVHPWAWAIFVPFIVVATFTILNLFIGIIVSTMQELATEPPTCLSGDALLKTLDRMERDLRDLKLELQRRFHSEHGPSGPAESGPAGPS